ncbi:hypothetical protein ACEN9F_16320 [Duganella sp. CT11-25]|uniref:hypothetical protein n=1 Tax=unclassified Duganella TaxID=2636909 RepID=UPI0039AF6FB5
MKTPVKTFALVLLSLPLLASAAGKVATSTMQVSFVVKEACTVQSTTTAAAKTPAVTCQLNTPYQITRGADKAAAASTSSDTGMAIRPEAGAQDWTITF